METVSLYFAAAIIVGVLFPIYALLYGGKTHQLLLEQPHKKVEVYRFTIIQLILLAILATLPLMVDQLDPNTIGLGFIAKPLPVMGLFALSFLGLWLLNLVKITPQSAQKISRQNSRVQFLMPTNAREYRTVITVSLVAGICEEIIYRGFLLWFLSNYMPLVPAIILANLPFALAHLTSTGIKNTLGAFVLALIFTGAFLLTKSLWLPILLHILIDLYAATLSYKSSQALYATEQPEE